MIDILLATYNGETYLSEQIESIRSQSFQDWHLLVSDDGSSDGTVDVIRHYEALDDRIRCINEEARRGGACPNFMHLLRHSDAEYSMFCDQDDVWLPNKVELELNRIREIEDDKEGNRIPALVFSDMTVVDSGLITIHESFEAQSGIDPSKTEFMTLMSNPIAAGCTILINKPLRDLMLLTPQGQPMSMHDWWATLVASAFGVIGHVDEATSLYRQHGANELGAVSNSNLNTLRAWKTAPLGILKILSQAESFFEVYGGMLRPQDASRLKALASVRTAPRAARLPLMIKSQSWKKGKLRKIGEAVTLALMSMEEYPLSHC